MDKEGQMKFKRIYGKENLAAEKKKEKRKVRDEN